MSDSSDVPNTEQTLEELSVKNINFETTAIAKYSTGVEQTKEAEDSIKIKNSLLYGKYDGKINNNKEDLEFVLSQITETINLIESADMDLSSENKKDDAQSVQKDFVPFNVLQECKNEEKGLVLYDPKIKLESQWGYDTQLAEIGDNIDALCSVNENAKKKQDIKDCISNSIREVNDNVCKEGVLNTKSKEITDMNVIKAKSTLCQNKEFVSDSQDTELYNMVAIYDKEQTANDDHFDDKNDPPTSPILFSQIVKKKKYIRPIPITKPVEKCQTVEHVSNLAVYSDSKNIDDETYIPSQCFPNDLFEEFMITHNEEVKCENHEVEDENEVNFDVIKEKHKSKSEPNIMMNTLPIKTDKVIITDVLQRSYSECIRKKIKRKADDSFTSWNDCSNYFGFMGSNKKMKTNETKIEQLIPPNNIQVEFVSDEDNTIDEINPELSTDNKNVKTMVSIKNNIESEKVLNEVKNVFKDADVSEQSNIIEKNVFGHLHPKEPIKPAENSGTEFQELKPASNKNIQISEEALNKVKNVFKEVVVIPESILSKIIEEENDFGFIPPKELIKPEENSSSGFQGFKTANNKNVQVSEKASNNVKNLFKDVEIIPQSILSKIFEEEDDFGFLPPKELIKPVENNTTGFQGFKTGSNKNVQVSEKALNKVKNVFKDVEIIPQSVLSKIFEEDDDFGFLPLKEPIKPVENNSMEFQGFKTGSNKNVQVSKKALNKVKNVFKDVDVISQTVLSKIMEEEDDCNFLAPKETINHKENSTGFQGFKTGSNKNVQVSEKALNKVKNVFKDVDVISQTVLSKIMEEEDDCNFLAPKETINPKVNNTTGFEGFKTGSNKNVQVSEKALNKVKNVFKDVDVISQTVLSKIMEEEDDCNFLAPKETINPGENSTGFQGFKTGSNKNVQISEKALNKVKNVFKDVDVISQTESKIIEEEKNDFYPLDASKKTKEILHNIDLSPIDKKDKNKIKSKSEVLFDNITQEISETAEAFLIDENIPCSPTITKDDLYTPSSPILVFKGNSKKRKLFKAPYINESKNKTENETTHKVKKMKINDNISIDRNLIENSESEKELSLGNLYNEKKERRHNMITLNELKKINDSHSNEKEISIDTEILHLSPENFMTYQFKGPRLDIKTGFKSDVLSINDVINIFITHPDLNRKLIPEGWILNHIKWIIWKLASYERTFKNLSVHNLILTLSNVLKQLKYRYDRELYGAERTILRKILEKDEISSKRMVLCVSKIIPINPDLISGDVEKSMFKNLKSEYEIELTDGWYGVTTVIDSVLSAAITSGKITIGTKLMIYGAELLNCSQGAAPLEDISAVRLKIWANSCRRCMPFLKLGLCKNSSRPLPLKLSSSTIGGGPISVLHCIPITMYPILYLNKASDGTITMRSEKLQQIYNNKSESELQIKIEQLYELVEKEFIDDEKNKPKINYGKMVIAHEDDSPEKLTNILENIGDPHNFLNSLTISQRNAVEQFKSNRRTELRQKIDYRVKELMSEQGLINEQAVKVIKCRILSPGDKHVKSAILTIWRPDDAILDIMREGICLEITNITPTGTRSDELHVSGGRRTKLLEIPLNKHISKFPNLNEFKRSCTQFQAVYSSDFSPKFNEIDIVGFVIDIEPKTFDSLTENKNLNKMQTVYVADEEMNLLAIIFWGGIKKYGYEKVIEENRCLACANLQYRSKSISRRIRQLHAFDLSTFTQCPKKPYLDTALKNLESNLKKMDTKNYLKECLEKLRTIQDGSKRHLFSNADKSDVTNLDASNSKENKTMESSLVNPSNISSFMLTKINISSILNENMVNTNTSKVESKINKLKIYGEAPPLSPMVLKSSKKLRNSFTMPVFNKSDDYLQANTSICEETKTETRTENTDAFAEEFNYSPPMSFE